VRKHPRFSFYPEQQSWHCFGACSTGGDVFAFIMKNRAAPSAKPCGTLATVGVNVPVF